MRMAAHRGHCFARVWGYSDCDTPTGYERIPPHGIAAGTPLPRTGDTLMALSEFAVRRAKPRETPYKLFDGDGLHLLVNPTGSKLWRLKYRYCGTEKLLSFGPYPLVSVLDARQKRDEAKRTLLAGTDPSADKRRRRQTAQQRLLTESP